MTNSSICFVTILNLESLLNFGVKVLRFTQSNKNAEYNTKFSLQEGPKINVLNFSFFAEFPQIFEKS